jgi:hypothetical protein
MKAGVRFDPNAMQYSAGSEHESACVSSKMQAKTIFSNFCSSEMNNLYYMSSECI